MTANICLLHIKDIKYISVYFHRSSSVFAFYFRFKWKKLSIFTHSFAKGTSWNTLQSIPLVGACSIAHLLAFTPNNIQQLWWCWFHVCHDRKVFSTFRLTPPVFRPNRLWRIWPIPTIPPAVPVSITDCPRLSDFVDFISVKRWRKTVNRSQQLHNTSPSLSSSKR